MNSDNQDGKECILIIDDVLKNMQYLYEVFRNEGFRPVFVHDDNEAFEKMCFLKISLVLIDMTRFDINCYDIIRFMKSREDHSNIPVICLTSSDFYEEILRGFAAGAVDCIAKPFNTLELVYRVKIHLELKKARDLIFQNNREMERHLAMKDEFFSIIAHDLKNPFNTILGLTDLLRKKYPSMDDEAREQFLDDLHESALRIYNLLENLLEWSRIRTSRSQCNPSLYAIGDMVRLVMSLFRQNAREKNILLTVDGDTDLTVYADRNMTETILRNLVSNAVKFTDKGGEVRISISRGKYGTEIAVADTGIGMTEKEMELLFRADVHHTRRGTNYEKGTGMGLLLSHEMAVKNGGVINVESMQGRGSVFTLILPSLGNITLQAAAECHSLPEETAQLPVWNNR